MDTFLIFIGSAVFYLPWGIIAIVGLYFLFAVGPAENRELSDEEFEFEVRRNHGRELWAQDWEKVKSWFRKPPSTEN